MHGPSPPTLTYDDLPPGSDVRREYREGTVLITVPAGSPPAQTLRAAAQQAIVSGTIMSAGLLLGALGIFAYFIRLNRITGVALNWAALFFTIFCTAIVGLVVWVRYRVLVESLEAARRQNTVLAISPRGLSIETRGPFGHASHDLPAGRVDDAIMHRRWLRDMRGHLHRVWQITLRLTNGRELSLAPGRDPIELRFIIGTLYQTLGITPETPRSDNG